MVVDAPKLGLQITAGEDPRITRVGRFLRKWKLDELPQLFNVLKGDMSLVGPRPEVPRYVEMFREDYASVLSVRPGITDPASLKYRDEAECWRPAPIQRTLMCSRFCPKKSRSRRNTSPKHRCAAILSLIWQTIWHVAK